MHFCVASGSVTGGLRVGSELEFQLGEAMVVGDPYSSFMCIIANCCLAARPQI